MTMEQGLEQEVELQLMALADRFSADELGNQSYEFLSAGSCLTLTRNSFDGDTLLLLSIADQSQPLLRFALNACNALSIRQQGDHVTLELIAVAALDYRTRGTFQADTGLQITLRPYFQVQPFFRSQHAQSEQQKFPGDIH